MADEFERAELRRSVGNRLGGFYNSFRYQANRALTILPNLGVGRKFTDTLGHFIPFLINSGGSITINSSDNTGSTITFHNTANSSTKDVAFNNSVTNDGFDANVPTIFIGAVSTPTKDTALIVSDRTGSSYTGFEVNSNVNGNGPALFRVSGGSGTLIYSQATFITREKAGAPVDGDYQSPNDGMIVVDSTNNKLWVRVGGAWKGVGVA